MRDSRGQSLRICAILAVRNEVQYLRVLLPLLAGQRIDVVIVDNESGDGSRELFSRFMGEPILWVETLPFRGFFSLSDQLKMKQEVCRRIGHDWVIHHDADEIMEHCQPGKSLRDAIHEADESGHNVINFEEFVFIPRPGADYFNSDYHRQNLRYYFFEPTKNRLNRAWKRTSQFHNETSGGHQLEGSSLSVAPTNHILRHYIVLSEEHARRKYLHRSFDRVDLTRGWHTNRVSFTQENLLLPHESNLIHELKRHDSKDYCRSDPALKHFWEWEPGDRRPMDSNTF